MRALVVVFCCALAIQIQAQPPKPLRQEPLVVTDTVHGDSDDPAIWINRRHPGKSLVLGTDKDHVNGGIYVFDLKGKIDSSRTKLNMKRVNNIDIAYGLKFLNKRIDIAVAT